MIEAVVQRCSVKNVLLEISQNSQENTCARVSLSVTRVQHDQRKWDMGNASAIQTTRVRRKWYTNNTNVTQVKNFDSSSKSIFLEPFINYMENERCMAEGQFHSKIYQLEIPCSHAKMR